MDDFCCENKQSDEGEAEDDADVVYVQCEQYEKDLKAEETKHLDICADLSRQHKALQRDYMNQLNEMQTEFQSHRREYAEHSTLLRQLGASRDKELAEYDTRVRGKHDKLHRHARVYIYTRGNTCGACTQMYISTGVRKYNGKPRKTYVYTCLSPSRFVISISQFIDLSA